MSFPVYPDYKDSGVAWLGAVPSHWDMPRLKHFTRSSGGGTPTRDNPLLWNGDIPWVSPKDMKSEVISDSEERITDAGLSESASNLVLPDAVLIVVRSGILRHTIPVAVNAMPVALNQDMKALRLNPSRCLSSFLFRWVQGLNDDLILAWSKQGATVESIEHQYLAETVIPLPSLAEQSAIAAFLDRETAKIDALIAEQKRLIALLREKRQAVISHAVTKGLNPHAPMKASGIEWLGDIPAHWEIGPIKRYARVLPGYAFPAAEFSHDSSDWRLLRGINISPKGLRWDDETVYWSRSENDGLDGWELAEGDLVIGMDRPWIGDGLRATLVTEEDLPCLLLQRVATLRPKDATDSRFLLRCFQHDAFYHHCAPDLTGVSVPHLSGGQIEEFRIPMPPFDEGQAIADYVDQKLSELQNLIDAAQSAVVLLQERRAALISATVTGKIDVRGVISQSNVISIDSARPSILPPLRAVVGAYAIRELGRMGRMAVMKAGYLAEGHTGFSDLNGRYERFAAGPYDSSLIEAMQNGAWESYGIVTNEPRDEGKPVTYKVPKGYQPPSNALSALVGEDRAQRFLALLTLLKGIGRDGVEAAATLYAVWNDLLAAGKVADDDAICNGVLNDWHPEKAKKFKRADLDHWLAWMRRNALVPDGSAPRTDNQGKLFA